MPRAAALVRRLALLLVTLACVSCGWIRDTFLTTRTPCDYYLPAGFVGWATINYGVRGAPAITRQGGRFVFRFPANGVIDTATKFESGSAHDRYFYYSNRKLRELQETRFVWAASAGGPMDEKGRSLGTRETFFIGTEKQYFQAVHDPRGNE